MTAFTRAAARPFYTRTSVERLSKIVRLLNITEKTLVGVSALAIFIVAVQLAYPRNLTLPLQRVDGHYVGFKTTSGLASSLRPYDQAKVIVKIEDKSFSTSAKTAGISINSELLGKQLKSYGWRQRLVPGSLLRQTKLPSVPVVIDQQKQSKVAKVLVQDTTVAPQNASLTRQADGSYKLSRQITGVSASEASIKRAMDSLDPIVNRTTEAKVEQQLPAITDSVLQSVVKKYDLIRKSPLTLSYNSNSYAVTPEQITAWSSITTDETSKTATINFDRQAIRSWLSNSVPLVAQKPGVRTVTIVNGVVQSKSDAANGSGIDLDTTVNNIVASLSSAKTSADASLKQLSPTEQYVRQYTPTSEGLSAIINNWVEDHPGLKAGVTVREIGGSGRQASYNAGAQFPTASLYKLFVDWNAFTQAERGAVSLSDPSGIGGKTILQCIEASIVTSDNPCGKWLGDRFGWSATTNMARAAGYGSTDLNSMLSTANDTAGFLINLVGGSLMNSANTQNMLSFMQRQIYRSGIPAGSPGATVQDKVGFLTNIWNDAAIVRGPKSSYVLVVYTNGNNANAIKDLANRIYNLMQT